MTTKKEFTPERIDLTEDELQALFERLQKNSLSKSDIKLIKQVFHFSFWLQARLARGKLKLAKLRKLLFGPTSEGRKRRKKKEKDDAGDDKSRDEETGADSASPPEASTDEAQNQAFTVVENSPAEGSEKKKGHGRLPSSAYPTAEDVHVPLDGLKPGDSCPGECGGRLYRYAPGVVIRITGTNFAQATRYHLEKLRCALCGELFTAELSETVSLDKYDARFKGQLVVQRYFCGMPMYRQEQFQAMLQFPLPDATQWDLIESAANCAYPVFGELERLAANGERIHNDDTTVKILDVIAENGANPQKKRTGMFTTGLIAQAQEHAIALFYSGVRHAGENLEEILHFRDPHLDPIIQMCDALSRNLPKEIKTVVCYCLAHGRRQCVDVEPFFPEEAGFVIEQLAEVYQNESKIRALGLNDDERLAYHQEKSGPILRELRIWITKQLEEHKVEPNSGLGEALQYLDKYWEQLTRFLTVAGAPLDNNVVERALKLAIRFRKNSLFYRSLHSAYIGSLLQSLIYTCALNHENPVEYLVALQENRSAVFQNKKAWLPWNYRETLASLCEGGLKAA